MTQRLLSKLIVLPLCIFALGLGLSSWFDYAVANKELRAVVMDIMYVNAEALHASLEDAADNILQDITGISVIPPVDAIMRLQRDTHSSRYKALQDELDYSMRTRIPVRQGLYISLDIANAAGMIIASNDAAQVGVNLDALTPGATQNFCTAPTVGDPFSTSIGQAQVPFFVPVSLEGKHVGCVRAVVDFNKLAAPFIQRVRVDGGYGIVAGPHGIIMDHPRKELIMEPVEPNDADDPSGIMARRRNGVLEYVWDDTPWLAVFHTGERTHWTSIVKVDLNKLFKPIRNVQDGIVVMNLLWLGVFAVMMSLIGRRIVSALLQTIEYARQVSGGALDKELSLHSRDEVGILADSLRTMVGNLRTMLRQSEEQQKVLERTSQYKSEFLANISHEIRTPMNAIIGFVTLFRRENLDTKQLTYLENITNASKTMLQILNDVLDLSKIEKGKLLLEHIPFASREVLSGVSSVIAFAAQAKGIEYRLDVDEGLPPMLGGDPTRLHQVLLNLLGNSVKFTEKGSVSLTVTVEEEFTPAEGSPKRARVRFDVADTGIGISEAQLRQLFMPFAQADASITRRFGGTGLGLTISKKLVDLMGGTLRVDSRLGRGSVFSCVVPFDVPTVAPIDEADAAISIPSRPLVGYRILVVEDNEINQEIILTMLHEFGLDNVTVANNGSEALDVLLTRRFDLVLMDVQMPVMDGITATERLREIGQVPEHADLATLPVIALTANAMREDVERCLRAGMNDHISKPIMMDALHAALERLLPEQPGA